MIRISHRGNTKGKSTHENQGDYLQGAIAGGFDVECDIRFIDGQYYLGHDYPIEKTNTLFLGQEQVWCHAKDGTTLRQALKDNIHVFYDSNPNMNYTLTSKGYIWHWDGNSMIYVMDQNGLVGICSDFVGYLK